MADLGNSAILSQTDASNASGTMPSWSGSAAPSTLDDAGRALQGAVVREWNWRNFTVTATGTSDAKVLSYSVAPAAYYNGQRFAFIANTTNTTSATLNVNSLGAKTIKKDVSGTLTNLAASDMVSGMFVEVAYNTAGDCFVWVNRGALPTFGALAALNTVGTSQIDALAVTTATIAANAVDGTKIAANAVDGTKIALGSDAQGDVMYYDGTNWVRLAAGTSGQFLKTNGAAANPAWANSHTLLGTMTAATAPTITLSVTLGSYKFLKLVFDGVSHTNGASINIALNSSTISGAASSSSVFYGIVDIDLSNGVFTAGVDPAGTVTVRLGKSTVTTSTTTLTLSLTSSGNFDAGSVKVYGIA